MILEDLSRNKANEYMIKTVRYVMEKGITMNNETVQQICKNYYNFVIYN